MLLFVFLLLFSVNRANADEVVVTLNLLTESGVGAEIGTIKATDTPYGVVLTPSLTGLPPGLHGFHVHEHPNCAPAEKDGKMVAGLSAGGHLDPAGAGHHAGPYGDGHLGDLPALYVDADGSATLPVLAPRLKVSDLRGRSFMIHAGGDNYSDTPKPLGGGGTRLASGVIQQ